MNSDSRTAVFSFSSASQAGLGSIEATDFQCGCAITADGDSNERPMGFDRRKSADGADRVVG